MLQPQTEQVASHYVRTGQYRERMTAEQLQARGFGPEDRDVDHQLLLGRPWYLQVKALLDAVHICPTRQDRRPTAGGSHVRLTLLGRQEGRRERVALHEADLAQAGEAFLCAPEGDAWELLLRQVQRAVDQEAGRPVTRRVRLLRIDAAGKPDLLDLQLDHLQQVLRIQPGARTRDAAALEELLETVRGPNFYAEGDVGPSPSAPGEYLDRGEGRYYSFEQGLKDPMGRDGAVQAVRALWQKLLEPSEAGSVPAPSPGAIRP
jgi:hypothetical protein